MGESVTPLRVGIIGCGAISGAYLTTFPDLTNVSVIAAADRDHDRAQAVADAHPGITALPVDELLAHPDVDAVLNLTIPAAHAEVGMATLEAGKHLYGEKPLAASLSEADTLLTTAAAAGLRIACAPDTVLGEGIQTARKAVDDGLIGIPVAATAFMTSPGHESWHPAPEFYYQHGGGPLLDMGPYYLSALVHLLGPVRRVVGASSRVRVEREIASGPRAGTRFRSVVDTHVTGVLEHHSGALSTLLMSFEVHGSRHPRIEVHGTDGSLTVPDPNTFDGTVELRGAGAQEWVPLPAAAGYRGARRGFGIADLARSLSTGQPHRASGEVARHVLDVMHSLLDAAAGFGAVTVTSTCERPALVPGGARPEVA